MVRAQGGTETAIRLGLRSQEFYESSGERFPLDCGFVAQGYFMPCFSDTEVAQAHDRIAMQQRLGPGRGVAVGSRPRRHEHRPGAGRDARRAPTPPATATSTRRATCWRTPPRSPYSGVDVREHCAFTGLRVTGGRVVGVDTSDGPIDTGHVVLTGGPTAGRRRRHRGRADSAGGARHQVVVTAPLRDLDTTSCRWSSTWPPESIGGPEKPAECCGG